MDQKAECRSNVAQESGKAVIGGLRGDHKVRWRI